ncbi:MAG: DUF4037 domain-containing protein [Proteobacteria bacterium]|nr:DUF4037 domain-containing protein [Pseudomonadota bacterium]
MPLTKLLENFIHHLSQQPEVLAILCYGSYAEGTQDEHSDIDILVLCDNAIMDVKKRQLIYDKSGVHHQQLHKAIENWETSWTPVNDEFKLNNIKVEVGYNDTIWVHSLISDLMQKGSTTLSYFEFRPYTFLGLLENALCFYEKDQFFTHLKSSIRPYPAKLKQNIIQENMSIMDEGVADLEDCMKRDIGFLASQFYLFRAFDAAVQILFAINEVYYPASKREERHVLGLKLLPPRFEEFMNELPTFYSKKAEILEYIKEIQDYIKRTITH